MDQSNITDVEVCLTDTEKERFKKKQVIKTFSEKMSIISK